MDFWIYLLFNILINIEMSFGAETGTILPLYFEPEIKNGVHTWQPLIDAHAKYPIPVWAIVNVDSGPGGSNVHPNFVQGINLLKTNGIHTLGYVSTNYTRRGMSVVKREVNRWKTLYNPEGIFYDEMTSVNITAAVNYYTQLNSYAKQLGFNFTVGNPGQDVNTVYVNTVDTIMIFESPGSFPTYNQYCGIHANYPRETWGIFPYDLPCLRNYRDQILSAKNCVAFIYITNDGGDNPSNPWDTLPPYLTQLFALLKM